MNILITYFSGTGCTALAAKRLAEALKDRGASATLREIRKGANTENGDEDYFVLLFPVHAFSAPLPVHRWIQSIQCVNGTKAAVIAVSGGGEQSPNRGTRRSSIKKLRKKGYSVVCEDSIVMPSNFIWPTPGDLGARVVRALPGKAAKIADGILAGREKRLKEGLADRLLSRICGLEKLGAKMFGRKLKAGEACSGCGLCARRCPAGNIRMEAGRPVFGNNCCMCLGCVYACPEKAIAAKRFGFIVLKEGFDINDIMKKAEKLSEHKIKDLPEGAAWKGVLRYLEETEKSIEGC